MRERVKNGEWVQRDKDDSLDFGELDEILDDLSSSHVTLSFSKNKYRQLTVIVYMNGSINDHIIDKMAKLWNLRFSWTEAGDDCLHTTFNYTGNYLNKAEERKKKENEETDKAVQIQLRKLDGKL